MARSKKPLPLLENITIEAVAAEGKCLFHWNDLVVFVPFCVPGDVCDIQIRRKKHSFAEGEVVRFVELSKVRAVPFCKHFGVCGGCKWQNLPYEEQLKFKQQQVFDQLHRIFSALRSYISTFEKLNPATVSFICGESVATIILSTEGHSCNWFPHHRSFRQNTADWEVLAHGRSA